MEDSWELVSVPAEIQLSTVGKETPQDGSETSLEKNDGYNKSKVFKIRSKFFNESSIDMLCLHTDVPFPAEIRLMSTGETFGKVENIDLG